MKFTRLFLSCLALALITSCSQFETKPDAKKSKAKTTRPANYPIDLNAKSAPMNGYNYYNLPEAPKMEKKQQTSKNVKPTKKPVIKK